MHYVLIDPATRRYAHSYTFRTKRAAVSARARIKRHGGNAFIVAIPDKDLIPYTEAYIREHGTMQHPK